MTEVVNIKDGYDVYIGRAGHGNDGYFGNPFVIGKDGDREEVLRKFKVYFYDRLTKDRLFDRNVCQLEGKRLGCFCKPNHKCHGDIIIDYLNDRKIAEEIDNQDEFNEAQRESYLDNEI